MGSARRAVRGAAAAAAAAMLAVACAGGGTDDTSGDADGTAAADGEVADDEAADGDGSDAPDGEVLSSITYGVDNPNYAVQMAVVVADARGYFADEGIDEVEIIVTDDYVAGLIGGSLTVAQGDSDVFFGAAEASGEDIVWVGSYHTFEYQILGVGPGIEDVDGLRGGTVTGGATGSRNDMLARRIVGELGLDPDSDVQMVPLGGNADARLQALIAGQVDGAGLFPRHEAALVEAGGQFIYEEAVELPQSGLAVLGETLESDRPTVEAFLRATLRAREDMMDLSQKDELLQLMRDADFDIPEEFEDLYEVEMEQISADGGFDPAQMDVLVEEQIGIEILPEGIDWRGYVDLEPLHAAQEAVGLDVSPTSLD